MDTKIELVDLVDASGKIQKSGIPRSEVELYPDLHMQIVIGVFLNKEGLLLVHQRSKTKKVNPGDIDHVCGGIISNETPIEAVIRESLEETGVKPINLKIVSQGINKYNRYRYLIAGESNEEPSQVDPTETEWAKFIPLDELREKQQSGELTFVDEFFEETELALKNKN